MKPFESLTRAFRVSILGLVSCGAAIAHATGPVSQVYPRDAVVFGKTYAEWSAAWYQWASSMPPAQNPLFDYPGNTVDCSLGQSGPVFFLGGRFCSTNDTNCTSAPTTRSCNVPAGKTLFFPILNAQCLDGEAKLGLCGEAGPVITQLRKFVGDIIDPANALSVKVDGRLIKADLKKNFRVQSIVFNATLPEENFLKAIGETQIEAGNYLGVDDGIYVMLAPLSKGTHTLNFKGTLPLFGFTLDFTYNLNIQ